MKKSSTSTKLNMYDLIFNLTGDVNKLQVKALFDLLPIDQKPRAIQILFGGLDPQKEIESLMPSLARVKDDGTIVKLESFDVLEDRVVYAYSKKAKKFFKTEEDAEKFKKENSSYGLDWSWSKNDTHPIEATYDEKSSNWCTFDQWSNFAFTDEDIAAAETSMGM